MIAMLMNLAWMNKRSAGYPVGGSLEFRYSSLQQISYEGMHFSK
jgi:hypothetical protein